jgi:type IX secretion system PorP/SprF family membrane protein
MIKNLLLITFLIFLNDTNILGQQTPAWSSFYEIGFAWNPALTARWSRAETSATYRKEWTNFEGAPEYGNISYQLPFISRFTKMSVGFMADYDKAGPFQVLGGKATGTYRIKTRWFGNHKDVLSMGMGIGGRRYSFDPSKLLAFDGAEGDLSILPIQTWLNPDVSAGFYYCSTNDMEETNNHYYFGAAVSRFIPLGNEVLFNSNLTTSMTANMHGGYRYYPHGASYFIESSGFISYSPLTNTNIMAACRVENPYKGWLAAGVVSNGELFLQAGLVLAGSGRKNILGEGTLRTGIKIDKQTINLGRYAGIGFELYTAYTFDMDSYKR